MKTLSTQILTYTLTMVCSAAAMAQSLPKAEYKINQEKISSEYKMAKEGCKSMSGNAESVCIAQAKGQEKVASAELESTYKPTPSNQHKAEVAKAEAAYAIAREQCNDKAGNVKDVCIKEAQSAQVSAKADALMRSKDADANAASAKKKASASADAADDKLVAKYEVAKEKCAALAGPNKDKCLSDAKTRFGQ